MATSQQEVQATPSELGEEVPTVSGPEQIMENRYYIQKIAEIIRYLAVNEVIFCGTENDETKACKAKMVGPSPEDLYGLFFLWNIKIDEKLETIVQRIPASASYTSPDITNEVISVLGSLVVEEIASLYKASDVDLFSVKAVESRDANGDDNLAVVVRFVKDGRAAEHLLGVRAFPHKTADHISDLLLQVLRDGGFTPEQLVAQCYEGIHVLSGTSGGVQKAVQEKLGRTIPYVHCHHHPLHLVIANACSKIVPVCDFFCTCNSLHSFARSQVVTRLDPGSRLKRLLDHQRTEHLAAVRAISENFEEVLTILDDFADLEEGAVLPTEWHMKALGLLGMCEDVLFVFLTLLLQDVLSAFQLGQAALQDKDTPLGKAAETVNACVSVLKERRSNADIVFEELWGKTSEICKENDIALEIDAWRSGRIRKEESSSETNGDTSNLMQLKQIFLDVLDYSISEVDARFSNPNGEFLSALDSLVPGSPSFLDVKAVKPLLQLVGADENHFALESEIVKRNILTPTHPLLKGENGVHNALAVLFSHKKAFPNVYRVLAAAITFDAFSAPCESAFPCLTHILRPERLSESSLQLNNLVLLNYEKSLTGSIPMNAFLDRFRAQSHRLQL